VGSVALPSGLLHLCIYDCDYEIYNIVAQPYYCWCTASGVHWVRRTRWAPPDSMSSWLHRTIAMHTPLTYLLFEKKTLRYQLCSTHYTVVQINNCFKRTFVIKVATMKITDDLMQAVTCLPLNRHFSWWKMMNGTQKEGHAKSTKNALYVQRYGKRHLSGWSNIEQQAHSLSHYWVTRFWQAGRQLVSQ